MVLRAQRKPDTRVTRVAQSKSATSVSPTSSMSTSPDNNTGVGLKADILCRIALNFKGNTIATEVLWDTDQQSRPCDNEHLDMSNSK